MDANLGKRAMVDPWTLYTSTAGQTGQGSIEEDVSVGNLDAHDVETLADRAMYDAAPLSGNGYKVDVATALLREAVEELGRA